MAVDWDDGNATADATLPRPPLKEPESTVLWRFVAPLTKYSEVEGRDPVGLRGLLPVGELGDWGVDRRLLLAPSLLVRSLRLADPLLAAHSVSKVKYFLTSWFNLDAETTPLSS